MHSDLDPTASADSSPHAREDGDSGYTFEVTILVLIGLIFVALTLATLI